MEGYEGGGHLRDDYADDDLLALREQERQLQDAVNDDRKRRLREAEKVIIRERIRGLGAKPCA